VLVMAGDYPRVAADLQGAREASALLLASKQLTTLPPEISQLTSLQRLDLAGNQLTTLPAEIGQLTSLQRLDLRYNQLTALPRELAELLERGLSLQLDGNPLREPLPELLQRGMNALVTYLRSLVLQPHLP
jgi:Leucine-rich repeat (LRR) protein